ncbi:uncharacterized protein LOC127279909 [Leptopilina boulardi]|uniref:uncharacterized protein LOC127279909 n=1 Tax=Leptopilina boulardi TaxID=63433 RepID=UPI0021F5590D|nr:uncharacterized protein LOC127279909 [Leptopilina boulardi]
MALPLLPANEIERAFNELVTSLSAPTRRIMGPLLRYYRRQWLRKVTPQIFSVHNLRRRTNNNIESYHRTLKDRFGLHSNIWTFSDNLVKYQACLEIDLKSLERGHNSRLPKTTNVIKDAQILDAWRQLHQPGGLTTKQFLQKCVNIFIDPLEAYFNVNLND